MVSADLGGNSRNNLPSVNTVELLRQPQSVVNISLHHEPTIHYIFKSFNRNQLKSSVRSRSKRQRRRTLSLTDRLTKCFGKYDIACQDAVNVVAVTRSVHFSLSNAVCVMRRLHLGTWMRLKFLSTAASGNGSTEVVFVDTAWNRSHSETK